MYHVLYIPPYYFCNLSALFSEQTIELKDNEHPAVIYMCMYFILYIPPFISVTPLFIFLIWLCMKAVAYDVGCVRLPDFCINGIGLQNLCEY